MENNIIKFSSRQFFVTSNNTYHIPLFAFFRGRTLLLSLHPRRYIYTFTVHPGGSFRLVCGTPHECMLFTPFLTVQEDKKKHI